MRIHTRLIDAPYPWDDAFDLNLRHTLLKYDEDVASTFFQPEEHFHEKHLVYFIKDLFWCHYLCIPVPNAGQKRVLFIGPFATEDATLGLVRSLTEQLQIPDTHFSFCPNTIPRFRYFGTKAVCEACLSVFATAFMTDLTVF